MTKYKSLFLLVCILIGLWYEAFYGGIIINAFYDVNVNQIKFTSASESMTSIKKSNWHLHVNLENHVLYMYKDDILQKTYSVSGGKASTPSPEGTWKVIEKNTRGGSYGGAWMGLNVPWGEYGIHGTKQPWIIGSYNVSGGCIRMKSETAKELYDMIPIGTTVTIIHPNRVIRDLRSGEIGSDVLAMQNALKTLGYFSGLTDGRFGSEFRDAVVHFQKDNYLYANGVINKLTLSLISQKLIN